MLTILDRQLVFNYLKAYIVCLVSLLGLFIVVDLFTNLDDFTQKKDDFSEVFWHIGEYYAYKTTLIFDRLSEAIVLLAAMFTIAWMQRNNEILPLLSAGVSTRRIVRPILIAACGMLCLAVINQEIILPRIDSHLVEHRNDPRGEHELDVKGGWDSQNSHVSGQFGKRSEMSITNFAVVFPRRHGTDRLVFVQAKIARYYPPASGADGFWILEDIVQEEGQSGAFKHEMLEPLAPKSYKFTTKELTFDTLTRSKNWFFFMPTTRLLEEMATVDSSKLANVAVIFHMRLTRPILGILLVFMGLSIILRDQNRNVFVSAGQCLLLCAVFFAAGFWCKYLGDHNHLAPALAAWLPVLFFGPLSFVMFDAVHT